MNAISKYFGKKINIVGLIEKVNTTKTKNNERMAFMLVSDNTGQIDITLFPKVYNQYKSIDKGKVFLINGEVQKRYDKYQLIVNSIAEL